MTDATPRSSGNPAGSVLLMSGDARITQGLADAFPKGAAPAISREDVSFATVNGHAGHLVAKHDVIVFEARPDDPGEVEALSRLLSGTPDRAIFLALADPQLPLSEARKLREAGVDEVLPATIDGLDLGRAIQASLLRRAKAVPANDRAPGNVLSVAQARGGVGATTVAVNLAARLAASRGLFRKAQPSRVVLVDFDLQFGTANVLLDVEDRGDLLRLLEAGQVPDPSEIAEAVDRTGSGVDLLCAPAPLVPLTAMSPDFAVAVIEALQARYDYVIVDLPRALVDWVGPVLDRSDRLIVVTDTSVPCIRHAKRLIDFVRDKSADIAVDLVVNRERRRWMRPPQVREAEAILGTRFAYWLPDMPREARRALDLGRPVIELHPRSRLSKSIDRLAAEIRKSLLARAHKTA